MSHTVELETETIADHLKLEAKNFPEKTLFSLPVLTQRADEVYQGAFLYQNDPDNQGAISRPFAWSLLPIKDSPQQLFSWCTLMDFMDTTLYPLNERVSMGYPKEEVGSRNKRLALEKELYNLFQELVTFSFKKSLTKKQIGAMDRYKELFLQMVPPGLYPFYDSLSPDFFQWLELPLIVPKGAAALKVAPAEGGDGEIHELLEQLSQQFSEKIQVDHQKEGLYTQLHQELQEYKAGVLERITYSVERDVILVIDNLEKTKQRFAQEPPTPAGYQRMLQLFDTIKQDLVDLLYRQGVDPYMVEGETVQLPRQKVLSTISTTDPQLDKKIAEKLTQGWEKASQVVRPEYVTVYLYDKDGKDKGAVSE